MSNVRVFSIKVASSLTAVDPKSSVEWLLFAEAPQTVSSHFGGGRSLPEIWLVFSGASDGSGLLTEMGVEGRRTV